MANENDGKSIEQIAADNNSLRADLREAQKQAGQVAPLRKEIERLESELKKQKEKYGDAQQDIREQDELIGVLEAQAREAANVESDKLEAENKAKGAIEEREQAKAELAEQRNKNDDLMHKLDTAHNEIQRLKRHEEHTEHFARVVGLTKDLVG